MAKAPVASDPQIIKLINCSHIQIGDKNTLTITKEGVDISKAESGGEVLTKNQVGLLLVKPCFEKLQADTLTYDDLNDEIQAQLAELKDTKLKSFKAIAGFPLSDFLILNREHFALSTRKGKRIVKLRCSRQKQEKKSKAISSGKDHYQTFEERECESQEHQNSTQISSEEPHCMTKHEDGDGQWTKVVKGKKKSKKVQNEAIQQEQTYAKVVSSQCPKQDIDLEKFKSLLHTPVDRDHIFVPDLNIYEKNKFKFMLDIVSMWNTPQRTHSYIVLGVEESLELPHKLVSLEWDVDDEYFQNMFVDGHFTMRPKFKYYHINHLGGSFGFIEIQSSHGYGQPCIATKNVNQDDVVITENEMWFRQGIRHCICKPTDLTTVSIYHWFVGTKPNTMTSISEHSGEANVKNAGTSTIEFDSLKNTVENSEGKTFEYFWKVVHAFQKGRFVLVSGDIQNKHRRLEALSLIPWIAVYDFDIRSASEGLLNAVKDSIERKRSLHISTWKDVSQPRNCQSLSEQATWWCFMRGRREISESRTDENPGQTEDARSWLRMTRRGIDVYCEQLANFSEECTVITMVLVWPKDEKLVPIFQMFVGRVFEFLYIPPRVVVILPNHQMSESGRSRFSTFCDDYHENITICRVELDTLCHGVMSRIKLDDSSSQTFSLPTADGANDLSVSDKDAAWLKEGFDVLYIDNPYFTGISDDSEVQDAIDSFYRGVPLHWRTRYACTAHHVDIERDKMHNLEEIVKLFAECENYKTTLITLYHSPGSGGTTLAQSVLWKLHTKYPSVHMKLRSATNIEELTRRVLFLNKKTQLPVIMLIDGEEESKVLYLSKRLLYAIIIYVKRYPYKIQNDLSKSKVFLEGKVSPLEASKLSAKFGETCDDSKKRALEKLNQDVQTSRQDHHLYEFGLTRFSHEFKGIVSYVHGYLQLDLNPSEHLLPWQRCLGYLALVYYYSQSSVPCQFFAKLMNKPVNYNLTLDDFPYEFTQFVTFDKNLAKKDCLRICHNLVAKELLEQILTRHLDDKDNSRTDTLGKVASKNLSKFAIEFIEYAGGKKTRSCTQTTIKFILTKTFIFREDRDTEDVDEQKRKRPLLSKLLIDIPSDQPLFRERLKVLEKLTTSFPDDPNFFAHLGRFYAFCRPDDDELAEKFSRIAVDLCQKETEGRPLHSIDDNMKQTLTHVYHMYANIKRKAISRYTGWSENDNPQIRTRTDQFFERMETVISLADTACLYYKKSREATPERYCAYVFAYIDEIKVRLQICEFVRKQIKKQTDSEEVKAFFTSDASTGARSFIARSVHVIESLIMECYMDLELMNDEIHSLQHLIMWYNNLFKGNTIMLKNVSRPDKDDISDRCYQIAQIKLKYGSRSTFGNVQNITDAEDVNKIVKLLEEIFEQTQRYGFTPAYGKHDLERDFRDWIYAIRHDCFQKEYDIESVLSWLQVWQEKTNSPLSRYYIFIMKSLLGFGSNESQGKTVCLMEAETSKEDLVKMKGLVIRPKYPREWLGKHGKGIKRLLPGKRFLAHGSLTSENEASSHVQHSALAVCTGTILAPNTNRIGSYIAYDLDVYTVKVFFIPKRAKLEGSRFVGHRVQFNLAFSIELGYEAYDVALLKTYGCSSCRLNLEFASDISVQKCRCGTLVYKDELNETRTEIEDA